jgi:hypothetical protein
MSITYAQLNKYEASVWEATDAAVIAKIKAGTVTLAELQAGAVQRGVNSDDYGQGCPDTGNGCVNLYASFSTDDVMCLAGALTTGGPGALMRGGSFDNGTLAGVFTVNGGFTPSNASFYIGFRAAR